MIDLHTHTLYSDGTLSPRELVTHAREIGLAAVAVTDHDTVDGIDEAVEAGRELGVEVVPGVEINLEHDRATMDVLGYFLVDRPTETLRRELARLRTYRDERNARILERLAGLGYPIAPEELAALSENGAVGRPHIAEAMRRRGYVRSIAEAFERFLRRGAPAWVDRRRLSLPQAVRALRASGGLPVIAHPGIMRTDAAGLAAIVREVAKLGVVGLECYYPAHDRETVGRLLRLCERHGMVATGGSDFHGSVKPANPLGVGACGESIPDAALDDLRCLAADAASRGD
jgi:predicted metal-dependent phosphoesterase TrpH